MMLRAGLFSLDGISKEHGENRTVSQSQSQDRACLAVTTRIGVKADAQEHWDMRLSLASGGSDKEHRRRPTLLRMASR